MTMLQARLTTALEAIFKAHAAARAEKDEETQKALQSAHQYVMIQRLRLESVSRAQEAIDE